MITFNRIVEISKPFPGIEVGASYGTPALKVGKKLILRMHQKEDAIVLLLDSMEDRKGSFRVIRWASTSPITILDIQQC